IRDTGCSLKAFRTEAVRALPLFTGMHRFLPTLIKMEGGTVTEVPVSHRPRKHGVTKYGMWNRVWRSLQDAFAVRWLQGRALRFARGRWPYGLSSHWRPASSGDGLRVTAGAGQAAAARSRTRVGPLSFSSVLLMIAALQGPGTRLTYRIRVIEPAAVTPRILASGAVSGPLDSDMRL